MPITASTCHQQANKKNCTITALKKKLAQLSGLNIEATADTIKTSISPH